MTGPPLPSPPPSPPWHAPTVPYRLESKRQGHTSTAGERPRHRCRVRRRLSSTRRFRQAYTPRWRCSCCSAGWSLHLALQSVRACCTRTKTTCITCLLQSTAQPLGYTHAVLHAVEVTTPRLNRSLVVETALATLSSVLLVRLSALVINDPCVAIYIDVALFEEFPAAVNRDLASSFSSYGQASMCDTKYCSDCKASRRVHSMFEYNSKRRRSMPQQLHLNCCSRGARTC